MGDCRPVYDGPGDPRRAVAAAVATGQPASAPVAAHQPICLPRTEGAAGTRRPPARTSNAASTAWPAVSLVGSHELLVWLIRMSGTAERRPSAGHLGDAAACRAAARSATTAATGAEFPRRGERDIPDQERQPAARVAGRGIPARGLRDQAVPEAGAVNDAAVAAYRLSAQAGNPLSERKLAQMFGRTSRRWARARIADARRVPSSGLMVDPAVTVGAQSRW